MMKKRKNEKSGKVDSFLLNSKVIFKKKEKELIIIIKKELVAPYRVRVNGHGYRGWESSP